MSVFYYAAIKLVWMIVNVFVYLRSRVWHIYRRCAL
jgi:uncharacterized membrane protein